MPSSCRAAALVLTALLAACGPRPIEAADKGASIELVGTCSIDGDATDLYTRREPLSDGTPENRFGSFGSAIAWSGEGERFFAVTDRGPLDGATAFHPRFEELAIHLDAAAHRLSIDLIATHGLRDEEGRELVGSGTAFEGPHPLRFDPEGLRVTPKGTLLVSDEYGPSIVECDRDGRILRRYEVPAAFRVPVPARSAEEDLPANVRGRVSNHGFEGLAITPDGSHAFALLQGPLIQDHGRSGRCVRMLELDLATNATRQLVVVLDAARESFNEIVAVDDHTFLAIERDGEKGEKAARKRIVMLDVRGASDVGAIDALPAEAPSAGVVPVAKTPFLDLLDPRFGLAGKRFPEKIEGLAFGADLADGRHMLFVSTDNDLRADRPTIVWAFAIDRARLPSYVAQRFEPRR